ncbi:MAG TPA: hypothetical protein VI689_03475 [Acidimicrobiia bacterium]|jgi:hypothetical protein|nr:hypothetical protein [Acidimicrobiia bacterium]HLF42538.1 hypothetical protein [Acidimicrobiia bacterium]
MDDRVLVAIDVPLLGDERHKNWAKIVESVDTSKSSGWAFDGPFVATGGIQDIPAGSVLLVYGERGSRANPQITARVFTVNADATISLETEAKGKAWARTIRDTVERCLGLEKQPLDLTHLSDDLLVDELRARGWRVER